MKHSFLIILVGLMSQNRILGHFVKEKIIQRSEKKIFLALFLIIYSSLVLFSLNKPIFIWFIVVLVNILSFLIPELIKNRRKNDFQEKSLVFVDSIIGFLKSGRSFRDTLKIIKEENQFQFYLFDEIIEAISLNQRPEHLSSDIQVQRLYSELLFIMNSQHRVIEKMVSFRHVLKTELWFTKKAKQALLQSRIQSLMMSIFYISLIVFNLYSGNIKGNFDLLFYSIGLFTLGFYWIWKMGRNYKWKE